MFLYVGIIHYYKCRYTYLPFLFFFLHILFYKYPCIIYVLKSVLVTEKSKSILIMFVYMYNRYKNIMICMYTGVCITYKREHECSLVYQMDFVINFMWVDWDLKKVILKFCRFAQSRFAVNFMFLNDRFLMILKIHQFLKDSFTKLKYFNFFLQMPSFSRNFSIHLSTMQSMEHVRVQIQKDFRSS